MTDQPFHSRSQAKAAGHEYFLTSRTCSADRSHSGFRHVLFSTCRECDRLKVQKRALADKTAEHVADQKKAVRRETRKREKRTAKARQTRGFHGLLASAGIAATPDARKAILAGTSPVPDEAAHALVQALLTGSSRRAVAARMGRAKVGQWQSLPADVRAVLIDLTARFGSVGPMGATSKAWTLALAGKVQEFRVATSYHYRWSAWRTFNLGDPPRFPLKVWTTYRAQVVGRLAAALDASECSPPASDEITGLSCSATGT